MKLKVPTEQDCIDVIDWRNDTLESLRTPFMLNETMQKEFYKNVICNRDSKHRFYSIYSEVGFVAFCGLVNIEWENGRAEISLMVHPEHRRNGIGIVAVEMLLQEAFKRLRLRQLVGEVYKCNENFGFWENVINKYKAKSTVLPKRKFYHGKYYDAVYFLIEVDNDN